MCTFVCRLAIIKLADERIKRQALEGYETAKKMVHDASVSTINSIGLDLPEPPTTNELSIENENFRPIIKSNTINRRSQKSLRTSTMPREGATNQMLREAKEEDAKWSVASIFQPTKETGAIPKKKLGPK
jgi:hypothetical protein